MDKKKSQKPPVEEDTITRPDNKLLSVIANGIAISLVVIIAGLGYLGAIELPSNNKLSINNQAQTLAASQASLIDQSLNQFHQRLSSIAHSGELLSALDEENQTVIEQYQSELRRAFPEAVSVKLIALGPLGIASLDRKRYQLRNNIEVDILRAASNDRDVIPEAYKIGDQWFFSLAESIKSPEKKYASGALLLTLDNHYLNTLLGQLDSSMGSTRLIQQFNNNQQLITSSGQQNPSSQAAAVDSKMSEWKINFNPSVHLVNSSSLNSNIVWILLALIVLTLIGSAFYIRTSVQKLLQDNIDKLFKVHSKPSSFTLPAFASVNKKIRKMVAKAAADDSSSSKEAPEGNSPIAATLIEETETEQTVDSDTNLPENIPDVIFRAYDIRGIADQQLTDQNVYAIGLAIGSEALDQGQQSVVIAADGRHSSPRILDAMTKGLLASGRDVIDISMQPTPLMYFATHEYATQTGVMITGSHNPPDYNGIKIVIGGRALSGEAIQKLHQRIIDQDLHSGQGEYQTRDIEQSYIDYIINDVAIAQPLKIVIDAGNGVTGMIAPRLFEELGCDVIELYCDIDGDFPNHHPDPTVEANLEDLKRTVIEHQADLGIAFDGDGDRLGVVTATGKSVAADRLLMLFAQDVVSRNPGADVIFDVKCTRNLNTLISNYGGRPIMWKTGHSFMKEKMAETGALLGGEFSGHIFFKERWFGFDDGMYAAARLIEILSTTDPDLDAQLEAFPESISSPELKVDAGEDQKFTIIDQLVNTGQFGDGKLSTLDGLRVDFPDGWGLVRASNTTPMIILRFEADNEEAMRRIKNQFKEQLINIDNQLQFNF